MQMYQKGENIPTFTQIGENKSLKPLSMAVLTI